MNLILRFGTALTSVLHNHEEKIVGASVKSSIAINTACAFVGRVPLNFEIAISRIERRSHYCGPLAGSIPEELGFLTKLEELGLSYNQLRGEARPVVFTVNFVDHRIFAESYRSCPTPPREWNTCCRILFFS